MNSCVKQGGMDPSADSKTQTELKRQFGNRETKQQGMREKQQQTKGNRGLEYTRNDEGTGNTAETN